MRQHTRSPGARPVADAPPLSVIPFDRPVTGPMRGQLRVAGHLFEIAVWTPEAWAALSEADRHPDAGKLSGGGWYRITLVN